MLPVAHFTDIAQDADAFPKRSFVLKFKGHNVVAVGTLNNKIIVIGGVAYSFPRSANVSIFNSYYL